MFYDMPMRSSNLAQSLYVSRFYVPTCSLFTFFHSLRSFVSRAHAFTLYVLSFHVLTCSRFTVLRAYGFLLERSFPLCQGGQGVVSLCLRSFTLYLLSFHVLTRSRFTCFRFTCLRVHSLRSFGFTCLRSFTLYVLTCSRFTVFFACSLARMFVKI